MRNKVERSLCDEDKQICWGVSAHDGDFELNAKFNPPILEFVKSSKVHHSIMIVLRGRARRSENVRYAWISLIPSTSKLFATHWMQTRIVTPHYNLKSTIIDIMGCVPHGSPQFTPLSKSDVVKKRNKSTMQHDTHAWLCACAGVSSNEITNAYSEEQITHLHHVMRANQLLSHAHMAMLRTLPLMRATMPPSLADDNGVPLLLAFCVHIALNPVRFGLTPTPMSTNARFVVNDLRATVSDCVPTVTDFGETAIDAVIATIVRNTNSCFPASQWPVLRHIPVALCDISLSTQMKKHLEHCADVGLHIIQIFHMTEHRVQSAEHCARWDACKHWHLGPDTSNPFTPEMWTRIKAVQASHNLSELSRAGWPLSLIPVRLHRRALIHDVILSGNDVATGLLDTSPTTWLTRTPGATMFHNVVRHGWYSVHLDDVDQLLVSSQAHVNCRLCNRRVRSLHFAVQEWAGQQDASICTQCSK